MNWQEQLDKKEKEFNLKGGGEIKDGSSISIGSSSRSSDSIGSTVSSKIRKDINKVQEKEVTKSMITAKGYESDYRAIVESTDDIGVKILKVLGLVIKLLVNVRTNSTLPEAEKQRIQEELRKKQAQVTTK